MNSFAFRANGGYRGGVQAIHKSGRFNVNLCLQNYFVNWRYKRMMFCYRRYHSMKLGYWSNSNSSVLLNRKLCTSQTKRYYSNKKQEQKEQKDKIKLEKKVNLLIFFSIGFIVAFFFAFVWAYETMFPEKEPNVLPNPLQVIAQLSCFYFFFFYNKRGDVRQRHLCLLILFLSIVSSLYLQGIPIPFLFCFFFLYSILILIEPLEKSEKAIFLILSFYCADRHLAKWGFFLVFQQFGYFLLTLFLEKEQKTFVFERLFYFIILLFGQLLVGFLCYQQIYMKEPLRLVSLLAGACIVFFCLRERPMWKFSISFCLYFFCSCIIAIAVSPTNTTQILGVPSGICIFFGIHFGFILVCLFFFLKEGSLKGKQPLIPIFFSIVFMIILHLPEVEWLERWIEGADLLLLMLSVFSLIENKRSFTSTKRKDK